MTAPTFAKKRIDTAVDSSPEPVKYGAPDWTYAVDVLDGTHATDRIQSGKLEHAIPPFDAIVYQKDGQTIARNGTTGAIMASIEMSALNDEDVINVPLNEASATNPITVWIKPGIYTKAANLGIKANTTIYGYGATIKQDPDTTKPDALMAKIAGNRNNMKILGLTFDFSFYAHEVEIQGSYVAGQNISNVLIKDCKFINPKLVPPGEPSGNLTTMLRMGMQQGGALGEDPMFGDDIHFRVINCVFDDAIPSDPDNLNTYGVLEFQNMKDLLVQGCVFLNQRNQRGGACFIYAHNTDVKIIGNLFYNSHRNAHSDIRISHSSNSLIAGNIISQRVRLIDTGYVTVVNNRLQELLIGDSDEADHDGRTVAWRGTRHVLIANNNFDTNPLPPQMGGVLETSAIRINAASNDTYGPKFITITGNVAHVENNFVLVDTVNSSMDTPMTGVCITKNNVVLRNNTTTAQGLIRLVGNTSVNSHGFKDWFIEGNYFTVNPSGTAVHNDIDLTTTGMVNIVARGNFLNNSGIQNTGSYSTSIAGNYGSSNVTRDSNSGTATIASASTSVNVPHGLSYTPSLHNILVRPTNSMGSATQWRVSAADATNFTINVDVAPGATTAIFAWAVGRNE